jgi:hypothetical protein
MIMSSVAICLGIGLSYRCWTHAVVTRVSTDGESRSHMGQGGA